LLRLDITTIVVARCCTPAYGAADTQGNSLQRNDFGAYASAKAMLRTAELLGNSLQRDDFGAYASAKAMLRTAELLGNSLPRYALLVRQSLSIDYIFHIAGPILAFVKASIMLRNICTFHRFCLLSAVLVVS